MYDYLKMVSKVLILVLLFTGICYGQEKPSKDFLMESNVIAYIFEQVDLYIYDTKWCWVYPYTEECHNNDSVEGIKKILREHGYLDDSHKVTCTIVYHHNTKEVKILLIVMMRSKVNPDYVFGKDFTLEEEKPETKERVEAGERG